MDALTGALGCGVDHIQAQVRRYVDEHTFGQLKLTGLILNVGEPVDVELEDLGRVLHTQPVTGAKVLIHTYAQLGHGFRVTGCEESQMWGLRHYLVGLRGCREGPSRAKSS